MSSILRPSARIIKFRDWKHAPGSSILEWRVMQPSQLRSVVVGRKEVCVCVPVPSMCHQGGSIGKET